MRLAVLALAALTVQRLLGWPGFPDWLNTCLVPMACVVAPAMLTHGRGWVWLGLGVGLAWDLVLAEPVIGPGGIAWSAAAVAIQGLAAVIADRRPKTWAAMGAVGAAVVLVMHAAAVLPLGLEPHLSLMHGLSTAMVTGLWCGLVGWVVLLDLPSRWIQYRARRLR